ncbi:MAG: inositol monophosphatase family protein [Cytophagales bacterium]|nr:inositol monophosphatase family protein [Cytophagales bacterium]
MNLNQSQLFKLQQTANHAATHAGHYIQSQLDQTHEVQGKSGGDSLASQVVTEVDLRAQEIILSLLNPSIQKFDLGLLTEETIDDLSRLNKDYFWCVDPLDGTLPFTERQPGFAVSIALIAKSGDPVVGVVYLPNEAKCYSTIKGEGVVLNDKPFSRATLRDDQKLHWYMDRSFMSTNFFDEVKSKMHAWAKEQQLDLEMYSTNGAVANAIGVMTSKNGYYFKFPKKTNGGGSIWDYAATRLLFEELNLQVSNANRKQLHLNDPETTFMNRQGVVYATSHIDSDLVLQLMDH